MPYSTTMHPETIRCKHIFLDVVGFTRERSVEAQTVIVGALNDCVRDAVAAQELASEALIFVPTGDGICVSILGVDRPYDIEMQLALRILAGVAEHNGNTADTMRRFDVRIGINENLDNLVTDINGHRNVAGAGISTAARIMDFADGQQILVGQSVYDRLSQRENYMNAFRPFNATGKHGVKYVLYQFVNAAAGVNVAPPTVFAPRVVERRRISIELAFYIAFALKNRAIFLKYRHLMDTAAATILLWFLARDAARRAEAKVIESPMQQTLGSPNASVEELLELYEQLPWAIRAELSGFISRSLLGEHAELFEESLLMYGARFPNAAAAARLAHDWPQIFEEFGFAASEPPA